MHEEWNQILFPPFFMQMFYQLNHSLTYDDKIKKF